MNRIDEISRYLDGDPSKITRHFKEKLRKLSDVDYGAFLGFLKNQDAAGARHSVSSKRVADVLSFLSWSIDGVNAKALSSTERILLETLSTPDDIRNNRAFWFELKTKSGTLYQRELTGVGRISPDDPRYSEFTPSLTTRRFGSQHKKIGHM